MATILFADTERLKETPVMVSLINSLSALQYGMAPIYPACLCHDRLKEELCGIIRRMLTPSEITKENIDVEAIKTVGIGGSYLMRPETLKHFRTEFFLNDLLNKLDHNTWPREGSKRVEVCAADPLLKRLSAYEKPDIDQAVETDFARFVTQRKNKNKSD
jgi:trimethylamine:corrinoid methyltransferase-like protein